MGPDEYHATTDNNVYTNVVAGLSIYLAEFAHCVGGCPQIPPSWTKVTKRMQSPSVAGGCQPRPGVLQGVGLPPTVSRLHSWHRHQAG